MRRELQPRVGTGTIRRTRSLGVIQGVLVGAATDAKAPFAMSISTVDGVLTHTLAVDIGTTRGTT
jgi:hypothetical protein